MLRRAREPSSKAYSRNSLGRPSLSIARVLRARAADPAPALLELLRQLTFRVIVGDEDGHGKNMSLLLNDGTVSLAPLYDSLSTIAYGSLEGKLGAPIGRQGSLVNMDRQALLEEGQALGIAAAQGEATIDGLAEQLRQQLDGLSDLNLQDRALESVAAIVSERVERLLSGAPLGRTADTNLLEPRSPSYHRKRR